MTVLNVVKVVAIIWGSLLALFLIVWPIACTPGRREERAMEQRALLRAARAHAIQAEAIAERCTRTR